VIDRSVRHKLAVADREPRGRGGTYSYTGEKDVSSISGDMVSYWYIWCCFVSTLVKILLFCIYFMTHLICASPAKIKAAKSHICIIDRAGHEKPPNNCGNFLSTLKKSQIFGVLTGRLGRYFRYFRGVVLLPRPRRVKVPRTLHAHCKYTSHIVKNT